MASVSNGFFSTGSMFILCCSPIALDVLEHGRAAVAHQLDEPKKPCLPSATHRFDGVGGIERDVDEDQFGLALGERLAEGRAVGEFLGVDAGAVQDQRQEMPDARLFVDHEAQRRAFAIARCRKRHPLAAFGSWAIQDVRHYIQHGDQPKMLAIAKFVKYSFRLKGRGFVAGDPVRPRPLGVWSGFRLASRPLASGSRIPPDCRQRPQCCKP